MLKCKFSRFSTYFLKFQGISRSLNIMIKFPVISRFPGVVGTLQTYTDGCRCGRMPTHIWVTKTTVNLDVSLAPRLTSAEIDYSTKSIIIECSIRMSMMKDGIKLHRCKVWSLDNAVVNDRRNIKLQSIFHVLTDMTNQIKNWKRHASTVHGT